MNDRFQLCVRRDFVHVMLDHGFEISLVSMRAMWDAVIPECDRHQLRKVLIEGEQASRAMSKLEAYEHGWLVAHCPLRGLRAAFCLLNYTPDQLSYLFTQVANGSFNTVGFFSDLELAIRWLNR